ncbi:MAG: rus [Chloroflexi bacterium]|nr:rus [Chloroflexota bacterium]
MHKLIALASILLIAVGLAGLAVPTMAAPSGQGGPTLNLIAGQGDGVISMNGFIGDPGLAVRAPLAGGSGVRVAVGTTVTWTNGSDESHFVTFLAGGEAPHLLIPQPEDPTGRPPMFNPEFLFPTAPLGPWDGATFANSGELQRGQQFSLTFSRAGSYLYTCLFHKNVMNGVVEVVEAGASGLTNQAAVDAFAANHMTNVHEPQLALIMATRNTAEQSPLPDGSSLWAVRAGTDWKNGHLDVEAFMPEDLTVRQGDTVLWNVDQNVPHTVTFVGQGAARPDFILIQLPDGTMMSFDPSGPPPEMPPGPVDPSQMPRFILGPAAIPGRASPVHNGVGLYNSGLIGFDSNEPLAPPGSPATATWSLSFGAPGTYDYVCLLHEQLGMKGTVTVLPR